jgi:hypothetical protein
MRSLIQSLFVNDFKGFKGSPPYLHETQLHHGIIIAAIAPNNGLVSSVVKGSGKLEQ